MITITIIICITAILIVAIVCYKEYKMSNGSNLERIESKLNSLDIVLRCNDRTLGNLAESISQLPKQGISPKGTCDTSWCENEL